MSDERPINNRPMGFWEGFWGWMHTTGPRDLLLAGATVASSVAAIMSGCNAKEIRDVHNQTVDVRTEAEDAAQKARRAAERADVAAEIGVKTNARVKSVEGAVNDLWLEGVVEAGKDNKGKKK